MVSVLCVIATHKLVAMMAGDSLSEMYRHYSFDKFSFSYLLMMSAMMFCVYFLMTGLAYTAWIR